MERFWIYGVIFLCCFQASNISVFLTCRRIRWKFCDLVSCLVFMCKKAGGMSMLVFHCYLLCRIIQYQ